MANRKNPLGRIRLVYRRSSPLLKCVVLAAIVLCTGALLILRGSVRRLKQTTEDLRAQAAVLEQENKKLEKSIAELGTVRSIKRIAREELGLVDPDDIFYEPEEQLEETD